MSRLGIKKPIEWIAMTLTQLARDEQRLHLNRQRTQAVGERLISQAPRLDRDFALTPFEAEFPN